jgi:hypothetical protein
MPILPRDEALIGPVDAESFAERQITMTKKRKRK